jgi:hypothetical protein
MLPRGYRNNNPGNIRPNPKWNWLGEVAPDVGDMGAYCRFSEPVYGLRAMIRDVRNKRRRGLNTLMAIKSVYAPAADNNDVGAYARVVANTMSRILETQILPAMPLPEDTEAVRIAMAKGMVLMELGNPYNHWVEDNKIVLPYWYSDALYLEAAQLEAK